MRIAVFSDSHGALENISRALEKAWPLDMICFAGDGCRDIERWLSGESDGERGGGGRSRRRVQTEIIQGNCHFAVDYPPEVVLPAGGMRILLTHGHFYSVKSSYQRLIYRAEELQVDAVFFGHTHIPEYTQVNGIWLINPGSISNTGSSGKPSYALVVINEGQIDVQLQTLG